MVLGTAETLGSHKDGFEEIDSKLKIFKRSDTSESTQLNDFPSSFYHSNKIVNEKRSSPKVIEIIQTIADQIASAVCSGKCACKR